MSSLVARRARELSGFLLAIHDGAAHRGHREAQRFTLIELTKLVPFDVAVIGTGTIERGVSRTHDSVLYGLPREFMRSWERVAAEDRIIIEAMKHPGRSVVHDGRKSKRYGDRAGQHARLWGIAHVLGHAQVYETSGLYWVIGLARRDAQQPFSSVEKELIDLVAPHLLAVHRRARLEELRRAAVVETAGIRATALVNREGLLLEAEPTLPHLLGRAWPGWSGPWLPPEARLAIGDDSVFCSEQGSVVLRFRAVDDGFLLHVRSALPADTLTARERQIAVAFSLGDTSRQLAARLGLAQNTVRRHLANVYEKLGISSKTELERMLGER